MTHPELAQTAWRLIPQTACPRMRTALAVVACAEETRFTLSSRFSLNGETGWTHGADDVYGWARLAFSYAQMLIEQCGGSDA